MRLTGMYANVILRVAHLHHTSPKIIACPSPIRTEIMSHIPHKKGGRALFGHESYAVLYSTIKYLKIHGNVDTKIDIVSPPNRHESYLLAEGERKVTLEPETRKCTAPSRCTRSPPRLLTYDRRPERRYVHFQ